MSAASGARSGSPQWRARWRTLGTGLLDLFLPRHCVACQGPLAAHEPGVVCGHCWSRLRWLPHPQCARCGHPRRLATHSHTASREPRPCHWCETLLPYVRAVRSACWTAGAPASLIVHALKYDGWTAVADGMAARMTRLPWPLDVVAERAAVVPIPLAPARHRDRGFNQSALLARALARAWTVPVWEDCVSRTRATVSQTRLTPGERRRNVAGAFLASSEARSRLRGAHVVLVDDVVTTAATLNACAAALVAGGARIVSCVTFARAPSAGDRC